MRVLLRVLGGLIAIVAVALAYVLIPPHRQIRAIEPPLPSEAELRGLLSVADGPTSAEYLNVAVQETPTGEMGHNVVLLRWADGRSFMIDAGMDRAAAAEFAELFQTIGSGGEHTFQGNVADILGDEIQSVTGVGFTHLHIDHTQGLGAFCRARGEGARLYQTRWQRQAHNLHTEEGAGIVAGSCLSADKPLADGLQTIPAFPGLGLVALGGHTPGSTMFAAGVGGRLWLFSGDITNSKAAILDDEGKGFLYSYLMVPENTARTAERRAWLRSLDQRPDVYVAVSHDIADFRSSGMPAYTRR